MFKTVLEYLLDGSLSLQKGCFRGNKKSKISATGKIILTLDPIYLYMGNCSNVFFSETTKLTESKIYTCIGCCFLLFFVFVFLNIRFLCWHKVQNGHHRRCLFGIQLYWENVEKFLYAHRKLNITATDYLMWKLF